MFNYNMVISHRTIEGLNDEAYNVSDLTTYILVTLLVLVLFLYKSHHLEFEALKVLHVPPQDWKHWVRSLLPVTKSGKSL